MTRLIITTIFFQFVMLSPALNAGGVSVGNGSGNKIAGLNFRNAYRTENELVAGAKSLIDEIHLGLNPSVLAMEKTGDCSHAGARVKQLDFDKIYEPTSLSNHLFIKEFVGYFTIELKGCKQSHLVLGEEPLFPLI